MKKFFHKRILTGLALTVPFLVASFFNACANTGFEGFESSSEFLDEGKSINSAGLEGKNLYPYSMMSAEQVLRSMASVTGVKIVDGNDPIQREYDTRATLLASGYDFRMMNSPMWIGVTNLASQFCSSLINKEMAQADGSREIFNGVNFTVPAGQVKEGVYNTVIEAMAQNFWGRSLNSEEIMALQRARSEFLDEIDDTQMTNQNGQTRNLMLFGCTAMLASFESVSL